MKKLFLTLSVLLLTAQPAYADEASWELDKEMWDGSGLSREYITKDGKWYYRHLPAPSDVQELVNKSKVSPSEQVILAKKELAARYTALELNELFSELTNGYVYGETTQPKASETYRSELELHNDEIVFYLSKNSEKIKAFKKQYASSPRPETLQDYSEYDPLIQKLIKEEKVSFPDIPTQVDRMDSVDWSVYIPVVSGFILLAVLFVFALFIFKRR